MNTREKTFYNLVTQLNFKPYRKKPTNVFAAQLSQRITIPTSEGNISGNSGDWLLFDVEGNPYPCKDSVFKKTYLSQKEYIQKFENEDSESESVLGGVIEK